MEIIDLEQKLIHQAKQGSVEAYEQLILKYEHYIYSICLRMLGNEQEAFDAAQEVCLKIWRQLHHFEGSSKFTTWVYRIATNQCLDLLRRHKRTETLPIETTNQSTGESYINEQEDLSSSLEQHAEKMVTQDVITLALGELKEDYRTILVMRDMQGYSYDSIGECLNLNAGTVKSRLSRARQALKKILMQNKEPYLSFFRQINKREDNK